MRDRDLIIQGMLQPQPVMMIPSRRGGCGCSGCLTIILILVGLGLIWFPWELVIK